MLVGGFVVLTPSPAHGSRRSSILDRSRGSGEGRGRSCFSARKGDASTLASGARHGRGRQWRPPGKRGSVSDLIPLSVGRVFPSCCHQRRRRPVGRRTTIARFSPVCCGWRRPAKASRPPASRTCAIMTAPWSLSVPARPPTASGGPGSLRAVRPPPVPDPDRNRSAAQAIRPADARTVRSPPVYRSPPWNTSSPPRWTAIAGAPRTASARHTSSTRSRSAGVSVRSRRTACTTTRSSGVNHSRSIHQLIPHPGTSV